MSQVVIPCGFELVEFSWDRLPGFDRGGDRANPLAAFVNQHLRSIGVFCAPPIAPVLDRAPADEEPERWDGLS